MQRLLHDIFLLLILLLLPSSCKDAALDARLDRAEQCLDENPDSAVMLLSGVKIAGISSREQRARCALLYSQALDKAHIYLTSDSIIKIAAEYYASHGTALERFKSIYYTGRVRYHAGDMIQAITTYTRAEMLADDIDDDFMKGLLYREMGETYQLYADFRKSLILYKRACTCFEKAKKPRHRNFVMLSIGTIYYGMSDYEPALRYWNRALRMAKESGDSVLVGDVLTDKVIYYTEQKETAKALAAYSEKLQYDNRQANSSLSSTLAMMYAQNGDYDKSDRYLRCALLLSNCQGDTLEMYNKMANIYECKGDYKQAYYTFKKFNTYENEMLKEMLSQPLLTAQRDVMAKEIKHKDGEARQRGVIFGIVSILVIVAFVGYIIIMRRRRNAELSKCAEIIDDLRNALTDKNRVTAHLFDRHFKYVNDVADSLYCQLDDAKGYKMVYKGINKLISNFRDKKMRAELVDLVNRHRDDAVIKLREQLPDLSEVEYSQFCYHCAGFSMKLIALLQKESTDTIYKRRLRLKEKIAKASPADADLFLSCLS